MNRVSKIVSILLISELILGGGGRLIAFGPVTLRMILFSIALILTAIFFVEGRRLNRTFTIFLAAFSFSIVLALLVGIFSGAETRFWLQDIKPLAYVLILPFFSFVLEDHYVNKMIPILIISGGLVLSLAFFTILGLIHSGTIPFLSFYYFIIETEEFFFRAETSFVYKGFIYLCVALIFVVFLQQKFRWLLLTTIGLAIILTFTRGFVFALGLTYCFYCLLEKQYVRGILGALIIAPIVIFSKPIIYTASSGIHAAKGLAETIPKEKILGNRDESDAGRILQAREVIAAMTPLSFLIGHGFGIGVPSHPVHMEIAYLEIFHKQGILGIAVWGYLFYLLYIFYRDCARDKYFKAYYFATCFIFFQSITNHFINTPVGLSFALISLTYMNLRRPVVSGLKDQHRAMVTRHQKGDEISATSL